MSKRSRKNTSLAVEDADNNFGIFICEISHNRRVAVRNYKGKTLVDIREYYVKDGKKKPGRNGLSLTEVQWEILRVHGDKVDAALAEMNHLKTTS